MNRGAGYRGQSGNTADLDQRNCAGEGNQAGGAVSGAVSELRDIRRRSASGVGLACSKCVVSQAADPPGDGDGLYRQRDGGNMGSEGDSSRPEAGQVSWSPRLTFSAARRNNGRCGDTRRR